MTIALGSYFGENIGGVAGRMLGGQLDDVGWNCEAAEAHRGPRPEPRSMSSKGCWSAGAPTAGHRTRLRPGSEVGNKRGGEYLPERGLLRRKSTGELGLIHFADDDDGRLSRCNTFRHSVSSTGTAPQIAPTTGLYIWWRYR